MHTHGHTLETPIWADNRLGRSLISEIIASPPELGPNTCRLPSIYGGHREPCEARYRGKLASVLRRLHREWLDRELALLDQQFAATHRWDEDASRAIYAVEDADRLIARVLGGGSLARVA